MKLEWQDKHKQVVWKEVPLGSLITQSCGCVLKVVQGTNWSYPTFILVQPCHDKYSCNLKHRQIGMEVWDFYEKFSSLDMEASFGITETEAHEILVEWGVEAE